VLAEIDREKGNLARRAAVTIVQATIGITLASVAVLALMFLVIIVPNSSATVLAIGTVVKVTPVIVWIPLLDGIRIGDSGFGWVVYVISATIAFYPLLVCVVDSLGQLPAAIADTLQSHSVSRLRSFAVVKWPYAVRGMLLGLKSAVPLAIVGAMVGDYSTAALVGSEGLGRYIANANAGGGRLEGIAAAAVVSAVIGLLAIAAVSLCASRFERRYAL
jgi:NitT/TauT family transport system permease protein